MFKWVLKHKNVATFMGAVGNDHYAEIMKQKANAIGLNVLYQYNSNFPTGRCAVLITEKHRYLFPFMV